MDNGALNIKKGESMLNTVTAEITYLIHSNTDVTSLLSGTAINTIMINSNRTGRLMHVAHSATGTISQILEKDRKSVV